MPTNSEEQLRAAQAAQRSGKSAKAAAVRVRRGTGSGVQHKDTSIIRRAQNRPSIANTPLRRGLAGLFDYVSSAMASGLPKNKDKK